jgi:hypothetical protein
MQGHVERLVELGIQLEVRPVEEPGHEDQVARRRDGQELREALNGAEDERLPVRQRAGRLAGTEDAEQDGHAESNAGRDDDADALHARESYGWARRGRRSVPSTGSSSNLT